MNDSKHLMDAGKARQQDVEGIVVPKQLPNTTSGWQLYMVQFKHANRKKVFDAIREADIGMHAHYIPVYWHPYYQDLGYERGLCPIAEVWHEKALTLPIHPGLTDENISFIIKSLVNNSNLI